ncbi:hypothetical protein [uncultured Microbacterium sp.]|uniref:hypothetical protein n=1 Tax=uncultured Microbacterium sp. TaxID=191216 RepID=UPI0025EAA700|nr:hypothetical protein [uncultured Microbacterium sp.]
MWDVRETIEKDKASRGSVDDAIEVDGCLYLKWMPAALIDATIDFRRKDGDPKKIDEDTYNARLKARTPYRVKGKGRPRRTAASGSTTRPTTRRNTPTLTTRPG